MEKKLTMSISPHIAGKQSTKSLMRDVVIALIPATLCGTFFFGLYALAVVFVSIITCVVSEIVFELLRQKPITTNVLSAIVTGLILGLNMPPRVPMYIPIIAGIFAIMLVKMLFGGLGKNFANPAATARVFVFFAYSSVMTKFIAPNTSFLNLFDMDVISSATPLGGKDATLLQLFLGNVAGCIGETSALALICGGIYLVIRKVIDWKIPFMYLITVSALSLAIDQNTVEMLKALCSGGLMLGAIFMATDYATSPKGETSRLLYAVLLGVLTMLIRKYTAYPEGVSLAIIFMNLIVPLFDRYIVPKPFGSKKKDWAKIVIESLCIAITLSVVIASPILLIVKGGF